MAPTPQSRRKLRVSDRYRSYAGFVVLIAVAATVIGVLVALVVRQQRAMVANAVITARAARSVPSSAVAHTAPARTQPASEAAVASEPPAIEGSRLFDVAAPPSRPEEPATPVEAATTAPTTSPAVAQIVPGETLDTAPEYEPQTRPAAETQPAATQPQRILAGRPNPRPVPVPKPIVSDQEIEASISRGTHFLLSRFSAHSYLLGSVEQNLTELGNRDMFDSDDCGVDGLGVYALMQAGVSLRDPRLAPNAPMMTNLIEALKRLPSTSGHVTYAKGIRLAALCFFNRPQDRPTILSDLNYLLHGHNHGEYGYAVGGGYMGPGWWDNSNSQYGVLGVWSAAETGYEIPLSYWEDVEHHWQGSQLSNGEWPYRNSMPVGPRPSGTMTAAGIVSLFIAHDYLDPPKFTGDVGRDPFGSTLRRGLAWWETGVNYLTKSAKDPGLFGYQVFGIERVGLASGFKFFGGNDWYRSMARTVIDQQLRDGSWGDPITTSYVLIFLARGRHPVIMNKLRFDSVPDIGNRFWANRPRDLAGLTRWASRQLERPLNWQIINLERDWTDWVDSPVLYIASHNALRFRPAEYHKFRSFVTAGGMIFLHADGDEKTFGKWAEEFGRKLFPQYEWHDLPADHPLYTVNFHLGRRVPLRALSNGARLLVVLSQKDIARYWHTREDKFRPDAFRLGLSLFLYAGGKRDWRNKLDTPILPEPKVRPITEINLARLEYSGDWDPEPGAWDRQRKVCQFLTGYGLHLRAVKWSALGSDDSPIAHVTGAVRYDPRPDEIAAMKKYVEAGGVLLIDSCGGSDPFTQSMRRALAVAFPDAKLVAVPPSHPLLNSVAPGMFDLSKRRLRLFVTEKMGAHFGAFEMLHAGKGHVILSPLDITSGLLGTNTWGIWGWDPDYAQMFVQNLICWTLDGQKDVAEGP